MHVSTVVGAFLLLAAAGSEAPIQGGESKGAAQHVQAAEDARFAAMVAADTAALAGMLADDLVYVHSSGRVETKDEFLKAIGSQAIKYLAFVPKERRVTLLDDKAAVITGRADARVITGGQELGFDVRYTAVYGHAADRWQLRAWQTTRIPPASGR